MNYKEVFQLAQDKGFFKNPNNGSLFEEISDIQESYVRETKQTCYLLILTLIQKWLRDEHKIHVDSQFTITGTSKKPYYPVIQNGKKRTPVYPDGEYKTYEEALLQGINEALKLIQ